MNIYDIAKKCGVSISTVSRVMNNSGAVSEKTRKKVEKAIEEENFIPNGIARSLASNTSKTVGLMVPDIRNFFHAQAAYELDDILNPQGYVTILCNTTNSLNKKLEILRLQEEKKVDAIITVGAAYGEKEFLDELKRISKDIPVVQLNNYCEGLISVYCDEKEGIRQSIKNFKLKGYNKPIFISETKSFKTRAYESKKLGFEQALKEFYPANDFIELNMEDFNNDIDSIYKKIKLWDIDSIQFENDNLAIKFLKYFLDRRIIIPDEIGFVGFDNIDHTNYTYKRISSIDHKIHEHAQVTADLLMKLFKNDETYVNYKNIIKPVFIDKETT